MFLLSSRLPWRLVLLLSAATALPAAAAPPPDPSHAIIPGFERFFTGSREDAARGGRLLLSELNCTSCHKPDAAREPSLTRKQVPLLDGVGSRIQRGYLRKYLLDPHAAKPGTAMPNVLAGLPPQERAQRALELAHFLASTGTPPQGRPEAKLVATGRDLYHRVGCVACHGSRSPSGNPDKILPTSVPLGNLKAKYTLGSLTAFLENPHQARPSGRMPGLLSNQEARAIANYLLQGVVFAASPPNLTYTYYEGSFERLPDFANLRPRATGKASGFDVGVARRPNDFALCFEGYLRIDHTGDYRFHLTSDDGSRLTIDGRDVAVNDGIHAPTTVSAKARLSKGMHKLVAAVFNGPGGVELSVDIEGPGLGRQPLAPLVSLTPDGNKATAPPGQKDADTFEVDPELAAKGRLAFSILGCASCHQMKIGGKPIESKLAAPPLAKLRPTEGCLAAAPGKGVPQYTFSGPQRTALVAALASAPAGKPDPRAVITRTLTALNCYACHERDKVGGVEEDLSPFFTTAQPEMGEEGRVPPSLTRVGTKLTEAYLKKIIAQGSHDRPYMHTRMPRFGDEVAGPLVQAFAAVDDLLPVQKVPFATKLSRIKADGRALVGEKLGCIKCHTFAGHKAEGVQGIDMALMTRRLRPGWFHQYVFDPQKFRPGTRMPSAFPNGTSVVPEVQEGDPARQIEAMWAYLSDAERAQLPMGIRKHSMPLVPDKEAILYRNFIEGAGPRAIGVGYPEKAHLAFDANDLRLALLWQGAFIDAARHWTDRGAGFERPLGDNILEMPAGVAFAVLVKDDAPWPAKHARELGYKFLGYRLTPDQRPTFLYSVNGVRVEDFPNAVAGKAGPALRRTLTLSAGGPAEGLYFRAALADKIEAAGDGWFRINGEWRLRIEAAAPPRIRQAGGKQELLVPVRFGDGQARIVQEFVW
jgi:cytochrome c553